MSAIVQSVSMGLGDVAKALSDELRDRQRARAGNVIPIGRTGR